MDLDTAPLVIVPGLGGSEPEHWQSRWQTRFPGWVRFAPASFDDPDREDWLAALDRAADAAGHGERVLVVAHSLGCRAAVMWAARVPERVAGLFCVAPPSVAGMARAGVTGFEEADGIRPAAPVSLVVSSDDPHADLAASRALGSAWAARVHEVGALGHVNADSGLGDWQQGLDLLRDLAAGL